MMKKKAILLCVALAAMAALPGSAATLDPSVHYENLKAYYIVDGARFEETKDLLLSLPQAVTKANSQTYMRMDKQLVSDYFYHVSLYDGTTKERQSHFLVAKDESCVWLLDDTQEASLVYGTADKVLKKSSVLVYPEQLPLGSHGIVRVHIPGSIPYDIKLTSLNPAVAKISEKMNIIPVASGKTDIVVDIRVGNTMRTFTKSIRVVDTADKDLNRDRGRDVPISVGIGIGWGDGWYHRGGGIGIGVGPWW